MDDFTWCVYRIDYAGNTFLVERNLSQVRAAEIVAEYEARGHHQHYWAERASNPPNELAAMLAEMLGNGSSLAAAIRVLKSHIGFTGEANSPKQQERERKLVQAIVATRGVSPEEAKTILMTDIERH